MRELCPICYDPLNNTSVTSRCQHSFHFHCLNRWLQLNPSCPCCRDEINHLVNPDDNETYLYGIFIEFEDDLIEDNYIVTYIPICDIYICILSIPMVICIKFIEYKYILEFSIVLILLILNTLRNI